MRAEIFKRIHLNRDKPNPNSMLKKGAKNSPRNFHPGIWIFTGP